MYKYLLIGLLFFIACAKSNTVGIPDRPEGLVKEQLKFEIPGVDHWTMPNGLEVVYIFDDELPQVKGSLFFPGGELYEPADLVGLSQAVGAELREGSFNGVSPESLDKRLDNLAASIESAYGDEYGALSFSCLQEDFSQVFSLAANLLLKPAFEEKRFQLWKQHALEGIKRRKDNPDIMAAMSFSQLIYGKDSPYARSASINSIDKINIKLLREYHKKFMRPNGSWLVITGAVEKETLKKEIEKNFSNWQKNENILPALPEINNKIKPGIYVLEKDLDQSSILLGHFGPPRLTDDIHAMSVYNRVLGAGGFGSLLFDEIRTRLGLAYDINGGLIPGAVKGLFQVDIGTKNESAVMAIKKSLEVIERTIKQAPPEELFKESKSAAKQSFVFRFNSSDTIAKRFVTQRLQGYSEDYDRLYLNKLEAVNPKMVQDVANRWLDLKDIVIVIVGRLKAAEIKKQFPDQDVYKLDFTTEPKVLEKLQ